MLTAQEKQNITARIDQFNKELRGLRSALNQLNDQKSALNSERGQIGRRIVELIRQAKRLRRERDVLTKKVREQKAERDKLNTAIHKKIQDIKQSQSVPEQRGIAHAKQENPHMLERQIERLQYKLETEIVDFKAEQKIMKQVKDLQRRLDAAKKAYAAFEHVSGAGKDIDALRKKADNLHKDIQANAKSSQEKHEALLELSKKIDALRPEEEAVEKRIAEKQKEMDAVSVKISEKLSKVSELDVKVAGERKMETAKKVAAQKKKMVDRQAELKEKLKGKKTLTTEDLLVLQSMGEEEAAVSAMMGKMLEKKEDASAEEPSALNTPHSTEEE